MNPQTTARAEEFPLLQSLRHFFRQRSIPASIREQVAGFLRENENIEIEIGCGKGKFLVASAAAYPDIHFLGIDRVGKWMKKAIKRIERNNLKNVLFAKADALEIIRQCVDPSTVGAFHIYFPDPWPKNRHHKRRLLTAEFFSLLYKRLRPEGSVFLATDHEKYFKFIKDEILLADLPWSLKETKNQRPEKRGKMKTNYEAKYEAAGKNLFYLEMIKPCA